MFYAWRLILPRQSLAIFNTINHYCWLPGGDGSLITVRITSHEEERGEKKKLTPNLILPRWRQAACSRPPSRCHLGGS